MKRVSNTFEQNINLGHDLVFVLVTGTLNYVFHLKSSYSKYVLTDVVYFRTYKRWVTVNCCCSHYKELTSGCSTFTAVAPGVVAHPLLSHDPLKTSSYWSSTHLQVPGSTRDFLLPGKMMASYLLSGEKVARNPLMYSDLHTPDALTQIKIQWKMATMIIVVMEMIIILMMMEIQVMATAIPITKGKLQQRFIGFYD